MKRKDVIEICKRLFKAFCSTELKKNKQYRVNGENYNFKVFVDNDGRFSLLEVTQGEFNLINKLINGLPLLKILKEYKIFSINSLLEEWKPVVGYEGLYEVSNLGRIKSLGNEYSRKEKILKQRKNKDGYLCVNLYKEGKMKFCYVHRLVANAFIENTSSLPCVNHIDENPSNNQVDNLEWCTYQYNLNYGTCQQRKVEKQSKRVFQYSLDGELVKVWQSTAECGRNGFDCGNVSSCCLGKLKHYKGYIWTYEEINPK